MVSVIGLIGGRLMFPPPSPHYPELGSRGQVLQCHSPRKSKQRQSIEKGISPIFRSRRARPQALVGFEIGVNNWTYPLFLRQFRIQVLAPGESHNGKPRPLCSYSASRRCCASRVSILGGNLPDRPVSGLRLSRRSCYFAPRALAARA